MVYCEKCGTKIESGSNFCEKCGKSIKGIEIHKKVKKERPTFLKVLLGFFLIIGILSFLMLLFFSGTSIYNSLPSFYLPYSIFSLMLWLLCLYGLYTWKMWGFYGFIVLQILGIIISVSIIGGTALFGIFGSFIYILLLYFAMKPVWRYFE